MKAFCCKCDDFVDCGVKKKEETYSVKGEVLIKSTSDVAHCSACNTEVFHEELDDENLKKVYQEYNKLVPKENRIQING